MNRSRPGNPRNSTTSPTWAWYAASMTRVLPLRVLLVGADPALAELLRQMARAHPDAPVVPMPKPLTRDAFVAALRRARNEVQ